MKKFHKSYTRDTTLFMQVLWARGLSKLLDETFAWSNPFLPITVHFMRDGVVEIWEHEKAINWLRERLLEENNTNPEFLENLFPEYIRQLASLSDFYKKGITTEYDLEKYTETAYRAALPITLFFYTGLDERSPNKAKEIGIKAREAGDFFAENDAFVRKELSRTYDIPEKLAGAVLPDEWSNLPAISVLEKRLEGFVVVSNEQVFLGSLEEFEKKYTDYRFIRGKVEAVNILKGKIAFKGKMQGYVRIVKKQADMALVKEGDILVSPMTTPDFLPAMQRAAAFVTDEGGVTCHAAIVAREMKKPCVIGTKVATQVLKDGDLVEVDAEKGVITILS